MMLILLYLPLILTLLSLIWASAATVPLLKLMMGAFGVKSGHIETVHSFTNDQNLTDNYHPKERRGRAATLNLVLTETGAAVAAVKCLPEYEGKLTASAIRVPTPNVSMAILMLNLEKPTTRDDLNAFFRGASSRGSLEVTFSPVQRHDMVCLRDRFFVLLCAGSGRVRPLDRARQHRFCGHPESMRGGFKCHHCRKWWLYGSNSVLRRNHSIQSLTYSLFERLRLLSGQCLRLVRQRVRLLNAVVPAAFQGCGSVPPVLPSTTVRKIKQYTRVVNSFVFSGLSWRTG